MSNSKLRPNFLTEIIESDLLAKKNAGAVVTRFPPEPNGFLHIGHAKSITLNFSLGAQYQGRTHLRFDDTNPTTEDTQYVESIQNDVKWLGHDWGTHLYYASDYFQKMYDCALRLIDEGKAYVDNQNVDDIRAKRGSFEKPGENSPFRNRSVAENRDLFERMRKGEFADGTAVLRAKIDMANANLLMRDPLLYRIRHAHHHRTHDAWCIYPMYDYAHPLEDAFEGVTHSICTLEFETNRELYDWVLDNLGPWKVRPHQYEFARLALGYTVMSKRKLLQLVNEKHVSGWDDPRMPTIAGMRRRGVTPQALREFCDMIGVAKNNSLVDIGKFEFAVRADLEDTAKRAMAVLEPVKVEIENWPKEKVENIEMPWGGAETKSRQVPFGRELLIEKEDFSENPPKDWKRLSVGLEVRLMGAYIVKCTRVVRDASGSIEKIVCTYDEHSKGGNPADGRKLSGTLHWVHAASAIKCPVRLYDRLFKVEQPDADGDFLQHLNADSLRVLNNAALEPALKNAAGGEHYQFVRQGFFFVDPIESKKDAPVFNRTITLRDTWSKPAGQVERKQVDKVQAPPAKSKSEIRAQLHAKNSDIAARFQTLQSKYSLADDEADVISTDTEKMNYFEVASRNAQPKSVARWFVNELLGQTKEKALSGIQISPTAFARCVSLVDGGAITAAAGKTVLAHLLEKGGEPDAIVSQLALTKVTDVSSIRKAVDVTLARMPAEVSRYKAGEKKLFGVLMGDAMKESNGSADAATLKQTLTEVLG